MTDKNLDLLYQYVKYRENENTLSKPVASDMLNNIKAEIELRSPKPPHDRKPSRKKALQHTAEKKQHPENGNVGSTPKKSKKR